LDFRSKITSPDFRVLERSSLKSKFHTESRSKKGPNIELSTTNRLTTEDFSLIDDDWIAECLSLQPDRSLRIPRITSSWDALAVLYLLSHLERAPWITDEVHRMLAQKAYAGNYEGEWETVQKILEQYPQTPKEFYSIFLENHSPEDFFGNLVRTSRRLLRGLGSKARDPHGCVRKPQRHRGYRDKGTLRPAHRPAVEPPVDVERVDRRSLIGHPLIREDG
jgi:hypothetical protein